MKTNAPRVITVIIAIVLVLLAIAAVYVPIAALAPHALWVAVVGFVVLLAGALIKGL
jgi:hypothetical protein